MAINRTTIQQILDTVQELHNLEQIVTRDAGRYGGRARGGVMALTSRQEAF